MLVAIIIFYVIFFTFSLVTGILYLLGKGDAVFGLWYRLRPGEKITHNRKKWYLFAGCKMLLMAACMIVVPVADYFGLHILVLAFAVLMIISILASFAASVYMRVLRNKGKL